MISSSDASITMEWISTCAQLVQGYVIRWSRDTLRPSEVGLPGLDDRDGAIDHIHGTFLHDRPGSIREPHVMHLATPLHEPQEAITG